LSTAPEHPAPPASGIDTPGQAADVDQVQPVALVQPATWHLHKCIRNDGLAEPIYIKIKEYRDTGEPIPTPKQVLSDWSESQPTDSTGQRVAFLSNCFAFWKWASDWPQPIKESKMPNLKCEGPGSPQTEALKSASNHGINYREKSLQGQQFFADFEDPNDAALLVARLKAAGHQAQRLQTGEYVTSKWAQTRVFESLDASADVCKTGGGNMTLTTSTEKQEALAAILHAIPGTSCQVQCNRIREALCQFNLTTFEAMRYLDRSA
jgi:hypothetical protein